MSADTKTLRNRIKSVDSTLHLTKAMGLVASSKIRKANEAMFKSRAYLKSLNDIIDILNAAPECRKSPFMRSGGERTRLIVIAGDRGLAGGYNANVFRTVKELAAEEVIPIGKRACERFGKETVSSEYFTSADAYALAKQLCADFAEEKFDRLAIVSTKYISMMAQEAFVRHVLPLSQNKEKKSVSVVFEPDELTVLNAAVVEYTAGVIAASVRESFASEVSARRMAMDNAGRNAGQMIDDLRLQYNRARQSAITQEITEIVAGSGEGKA